MSETQIGDVIGKLQATWGHAGYAVFPPPKSPEQIAAELAAKRLEELRRGGFSIRSTQAAATAVGPALAKAKALLPLMLKDGILLLIGPTGRGKTVMATWLAMERQKTGLKCGVFLTAYGMFSAIKATFGQRAPKKTSFGGVLPQPEAEDLISEWCRAPLLVIDEMQTRAETAWENGLLEEIVNARYGAMLPTIMIANLDAETAEKSLGPRIIDRARECGGMVNCNWPSYRI